ncbi:hypothetical protein AGABI2DRAFT_71320 [Agaricus bisporus var. bisporus H97]|uniref:hypothetical protein n=1 Tax=Agaricus bisporus var. bisporus (strain H97 / ATCC MYA-4626 / FGSC 10389) TaxID=936046 RepID=UPI00029F57D0|nr:hypothetical protein AGABI2DRAFT_71320 [Agaricus bisporus var. bisporus H97]EKV46958.1 hypothetical protein AGABI2DRAFT_71320 [Agaricus bisporus var. bisporus H97]
MGTLGPLEVNPQTGEPFLRLQKHPNIILTPPRDNDVSNLLPPLNDERVHIWLANVPFPYTSELAQNWINRIKPNCDHGVKELIDKERILTQCPVRFLREIQEDGSELFVGDIGFLRCSEVTLLEDPKHDNETNMKLPIGDPDIVWTIGDFVVASHHGRGIMTDAIDTIINKIGKPLLGARHIMAVTYTENEGSKKVFLKNGFAVVRCIPNYAEVKGFQRDLIVLERHV